MWEIFTLAKQEPYSELTDGELVEDVATRGSGRKLLQRPEDVFRVMEECWVHEPKERYTFEDIFAQLSFTLTMYVWFYCVCVFSP